MRKTRIITTGLLIILLVSTAFGQTKTYKIGTLMWDETLHDEDSLIGFEDTLKLSGLQYTFDIKRVYGDETKARQFLREWKEQDIDLILTIGTKGTLWALEEVNDIPIVFTAVTNPIATGIAESWERPGRNVTGSSNWIKAQDKLAVFKNCVPHLKTLGVIYNPENPVSSDEIAEAKDLAESMDLTLKEATVSKTGDIESAVLELVEQDIDALWVPIEKLVYQNMSIVGRITAPRKLPVLSSTLEGITQNEVGMIALTIDYKGLGRLCAPAAIDILTTGKDPGVIPIKTMPYTQIIINANAAEDINYKLPTKILSEATRVLKGFEGQKIIVSGTGDSQEFLRAIAKTLENNLGGGEIEVPDSIGSGGGINALIKGEADLARVARPLSKSEEELGLKYLLFAEAPVVFAVHPDVNGIDNITTEEIINIYSGKITHWNEFGYDAGKIYPVNRESSDSCLKILNEMLPGFSDIPNPAGKIFYSTQDAVKAIEEHKKTIGFLPLPSTVGAHVKILKLNGIYPSVENVQNGKYKLAVPLAVVYRGELKGLAKAFVNFIYSEEGKKIITEMGNVPIKQDNQ